MFSHGGIFQNDIQMGLLISDPEVFVPWSMSEEDVPVLFRNCPVTFVTEGYYVMKGATLFGNLICNIGFHFDNTLRRIEFFRNEYEDLRKSYDGFQRSIERVFGKPTNQSTDETGFLNCTWRISDDIRVTHYVIERFGLEEHLNIEQA